MTINSWMRAAVLGAVLLGAAPAAQAADVTNPAKNPAPITLTIDGQTYRDGLDTLPGYDDYACTPIPNVEYDFAGNQIQYYDDQGELVKTANWTEWSRISSYETWVAQQQGGKAPSTSTTTTPAKPAPAATTTTTTSTATTSPAAAAPAATSPTTTSATTTSATTKSKGSVTKTKGSSTTIKRTATKTKTASTTSSSSRDSTGSRRSSSSAPKAVKRSKSTTAAPAKRSTATKHTAAAGSTVDGASEDGTSTASTTSSDDVVTSTQADDAPAATAGAAAAPKYELVSNNGVGAGVADTRPVGVGILVAVFAIACLAFLFGSARRRRGFSRVAS